MNPVRLRWLVSAVTALVVLIGINQPTQSTQADSTSYQLLVIAPREFIGALQSLVDHKTRTGMSAGILPLDEIYADPAYAGSDTPEQIKRAIADYHTNHATQFVLLVGDVNKFPVRWIRGHFNDGLMDDEITSNDDILFLPSDYYYADLYKSGGLFNDWDEDNDGYYGETYFTQINEDQIDFTADVMVGRLPAADLTQVQTYIVKVIRYEYAQFSLYPINRLLLMQSSPDFFEHIHFKEDIAAALDGAGFDAVRLYDNVDCCLLGEDPAVTGCYPCGGPIINSPTSIMISSYINAGVEFAIHLSHGAPQAWSSFSVADVTALTNSSRFPIIYSGACETAKFFGEKTLPYGFYTTLDGFEYGGVTPGMVGSTIPPIPKPIQSNHNVFSIGEAFLVAGDYGAIGYYGSMETGEPGFHGTLEENFFKAYALGHHTLGEMWQYAHDRFVDIYDLPTLTANGHWAPPAKVHSVSRMILLGDPSLRVGGVSGLEDDLPPETSIEDPAAWHSSITLNAVDDGSPASGVRRTHYILPGIYQVGNHIFFTADGDYDIQFWSEDMVGNIEPTNYTTVHIDTTPPVVELTYDGEEPASLLCDCSLLPCSCPTRGCFNNSVQVSLNATDSLSGISQTYYELNGVTYLYTSPITVMAGDYLAHYNIRYWSFDRAGNRSRVRTDRFCVTDWEAGLMRDEARILLGLEEIIAFRLRQKVADSLPKIQSILYQYNDQVSPDWVSIGIDNDGDDGWQVMRDSTLLGGNGARDIRLTVFGFTETTASLSVDPVLYTETFHTRVSNLDPSKYEFSLAVPVQTASPEDKLDYTLTFRNLTGGTLTSLVLTAFLDPAYIKEITVLDGGKLNGSGLPEWNLSALEHNQTWQAHFSGILDGNIAPGTPVSSQGLLETTQYPLLVSDDPATTTPRDQTLVTLRWLDSTVSGSVLEDDSRMPLSATLTLTGTSTYTADTDSSGKFSFTSIPIGEYTLNADAPGYELVSPPGPVSLEVNGYGAMISQDFFMKRVDTLPPRSMMDQTVDQLVEISADTISGQAIDPEPGSGVSKVEVQIRRENDGTCWKNSWVTCPVWLPADGLETWTLSTATLPWSLSEAYTIYTRATDVAGNVEVPLPMTSSPAAPILLSPAPYFQFEVGMPVFQWTQILNSRYVLSVARDPEFNRPVLDLPTLINNTMYQVRTPLPPGRYYWRVDAVSASGLPGPWSEVRMFDIGIKVFLPVTMK